VHYVDICVCHPLTLSSVWSLVESGSECLEEAEAGKRCEHKSVLPDVDNFFLVCLVCLRLENCLWEQNSC